MVTTDTHVYFYSGRDVFSNFHHNPNQFRDPIAELWFNCTEAAFMHMKAVFFGDHNVADEIARHAEKDGDPAAVKLLGRKITPYDDPSWECVREGNMAYVNLLKYRQNPEMAAVLKATGDRIIVEASPTDCIWGVGLSVEDAAKGLPWRGRNLLGKVLMTVRTLI